MTLSLDYSFPIAAVVFCWIGLQAGDHLFARWPLLAPMAFSTAVMLRGSLAGWSLVSATMPGAAAG